MWPNPQLKPCHMCSDMASCCIHEILKLGTSKWLSEHKKNSVFGCQIGLKLKNGGKREISNLENQIINGAI